MKTIMPRAKKFQHTRNGWINMLKSNVLNRLGKHVMASEIESKFDLPWINPQRLPFEFLLKREITAPRSNRPHRTPPSRVR